MASSETPSSEYPHWQRNMRALTAGNVLVNVGWNASFAFLPLIVQGMGVRGSLELWVGMMMFGYYAVSCLLTPVWGALADHFGRKSMILRAGFGMGAGFATLAFTSDPLLFALVLTVTGLANGYIPAGQALIATATPRRAAGGALAITQAGGSVGTLLGPVIGAALIGVLASPHSLFAFTGIAMGAAGLLALVLVRENHAPPAHRLRLDLRADIALLWRVPHLKLLYYLQVLHAFTVYGAMSNVALYTLEMLASKPRFLGWSVETWVAAMPIGFTIAGILVLPIWGRLLNRHSTSRVLTVILAGTLVTSILMPLATNPLELLASRVAFALFVFGLPPALIRMIRDRAPQGMVARTLSYGTAIQQIGSATAPLIAGLLAPWLGMRGFFAIATAMIFVGWILWRRIAREADVR